jgi:cysteinyl-tRNA synthetase
MSPIATGTTVPIAELAGTADVGAPAPVLAPAPAPDAAGADPLTADIDRSEQAFDAALRAGDGPAAVKVALELDDLLHDWSRDTTQSDLMDRGRATLRAMIVRLGEAAEVGLRDPRSVVAPLVEALLDARRSARAGGRYADADGLRDRLLAAGVEVRDTAEGTEWQLR